MARRMPLPRGLLAGHGIAAAAVAFWKALLCSGGSGVRGRCKLCMSMWQRQCTRTGRTRSCLVRTNTHAHLCVSAPSLAWRLPPLASAAFLRPWPDPAWPALCTVQSSRYTAGGTTRGEQRGVRCSACPRGATATYASLTRSRIFGCTRHGAMLKGANSGLHDAARSRRSAVIVL